MNPTKCTTCILQRREKWKSDPESGTGLEPKLVRIFPLAKQAKSYHPVSMKSADRSTFVVNLVKDT